MIEIYRDTEGENTTPFRVAINTLVNFMKHIVNVLKENLYIDVYFHESHILSCSMIEKWNGPLNIKH